MTKIVINSCFGGYSLSRAAYEHLGIPWDGYGFAYEEDRAHPRLVECIETLGKAANGLCASLEVIEIPDDVKWEICEYDGNEWVAERHRRWPAYA